MHVARLGRTVGVERVAFGLNGVPGDEAVCVEVVENRRQIGAGAVLLLLHLLAQFRGRLEE